jgi:hypothetical protein
VKRLALIFALVTFAAGAEHAPGQGEWILIDHDLHEHRVELNELREGAVTFTDEAGRSRSRAVDSLVAIIHERPPDERASRELPWLTQQMEMFGQDTQLAAEPEPEPFNAWLELSDGQRWMGSFASAWGETISWSLGGAVSLEAPLERVRAAAIHGPIELQTWEGVEDRVLMLNGDRVDGFIASIDESIRVESGGGAIEIPLDRAAGVLIANPRTEPDGTLAWLHDGSIIAATSVEISLNGRVVLGLDAESADRTHQAPTLDLLGLLFEPSAVAGLSTIAPASVTYPPERLWGSPPVAQPPGLLGLGAIDLVGPVRVVWDLPRPAARLATTATLPPAMWAWGDCEIAVLAEDGADVLRERLHADRPSVEINLPLGGARRVTIEVVSARGGPVQDRVVLGRPLVRWQ